MLSIWLDVRQAARGLRHQPAFTGLAVLALALGIGASTTIFSVIHGVLLDPFPYPHVERFIGVQVRDATSARPFGRDAFPPGEFLDYVEQTRSYEEVIAGAWEDILYTTPEGTEQFNGGLLTPNNFTFLGVRAALGRTFGAEDARPGAPPVFVMSHKLWVRRFGADPAILGRTFVLNGVPTTLVGIMGPRFTKLASDLWKPVALDRADPERARTYFRFQARMRPGVSLEQAEAEMNAVGQRLAQVYPDNYPKKFHIRVLNWVDSVVGPFQKTLYTLGAAVGLLLLIACANVANMLLARGAAREKEMAVRAALGASRGRLVQQLLVESLLLALAGAALGCLFAHFGLKALVAAIPEGLIPREALIRLNVPVLLFTLAVTVATALVFGLAPALQTVRRDLMEPLRDSGKGTSGGIRRRTLRSALVVSEVALSLVLLAGAGLLMRSFIKLQTVDLGLNPDHVLGARLSLPRGQYRTAEAKQRLFDEILGRLKALPGVVDASAVSSLPPYGGLRSEIDVAGRSHAETWTALAQLVSEGYFATLERRRLRGRLLTADEVAAGRKVVVVNRLFVERFFGGDDPLGRLVRFKRLEALPEGKVDDAVFEIVGVVADAHNQGIQEPPMPEAYLPYSVTGALERGIVVRTAPLPESMLESVRREIWAVDRGIAVTSAEPLVTSLQKYSYAEPRFGLVVLGVFAVVGLVLVTLGVYSVIAYTVSRRTQEIGIRMALGAGRWRVLKMVLGTGLRLVGLGVGVGLLACLGATRVLSSQLWGVAPHDPLTLAAVIAVVVLTGLGACYVPARRATRVDPMVALRYQ